MKYRRVFDGFRVRFVDAALRTFSSCETFALVGARIGIPEPHEVRVRRRLHRPARQDVAR